MTPQDEIEQIRAMFSAPRAGERLAAINRLSAKSGRKQVDLLVLDDAALDMLTTALTDSEIRVRRAAARGLRPWVQARPEILDAVIPAYASHSFQGGYSHLGLVDTRTGDIWVPTFAALKGHAALLVEGNTDRYFKFEFYLSAQAPQGLRGNQEADNSAHLVLNLLPDWSYSRGAMVPSHDDRLREANAREQDRYCRWVIAFYREARLPHQVRVHEARGPRGQSRYRLDVARIEAV